MYSVTEARGQVMTVVMLSTVTTTVVKPWGTIVENPGSREPDSVIV
jgi:hypothetical protein